MKNMTIDLSNRPVITVMEASQLLGLSPTSVKRRIFEGRLKALKRDNLYEKILIYTESISRFLERGEE